MRANFDHLAAGAAEAARQARARLNGRGQTMTVTTIAEAIGQP
jgi:hypothetical protein